MVQPVLRQKTSSIKTNLILAFILIIIFGGVITNIALIEIMKEVFKRIETDSTSIQDFGRYVVLSVSGITIGGIIFSLFFSYFLSRTITNPLQALTEKMIEIARGNWHTRIKIDTQDEIGQLSDGFNYMAEHVEETLKRLEEAKEYTDNIIVSVPSILIVLDSYLDVISTNLSYDSFREQYPSITLKHLIKPLETIIKKHISTRENITTHINVQTKEPDKELVFSATVSSIGNAIAEKGKPFILLTLTDITEQEIMRQEAFSTRQRWEETFNAITDMITIHDIDYNIIMANRAAEKILKLPDFKNVLKPKCYAYYHGTDGPPEGCPSCYCLKTGQPCGFEIYEPFLNMHLEIRAMPSLDEKGDVVGLIHVVRDITDRKKIEEALKKGKIEWEMTFDNATELIALVDKDLKIIRCNRSFAEFTQKPVHELKGEMCTEYLGTDPNNLSFGGIEGKTEIKTKNGRWLYLSFYPIMDDDGNFLHSVLIGMDITALKYMQERLIKSEEKLRKRVQELEKFYEMAVGRELRMRQLKKEIKRLNEELAHVRGNGNSNN
jgi:PAS domain-containing protein